MKMYDVKKTIINCWCPGHVGSKGNEEADNEPKQAVRTSLYKVKTFSVGLKGNTKNHIKKKWRT